MEGGGNSSLDNKSKDGGEISFSFFSESFFCSSCCCFSCACFARSCAAMIRAYFFSRFSKFEKRRSISVNISKNSLLKNVELDAKVKKMEGTVSAERELQRVSLEEERALAERAWLNEALRDYEALRKRAVMSIGIENTESRREKVRRERVTDWFYRLVDHLELERFMVYIAMNMLENFLAVTESPEASESWLRDQRKYRLR
mmetsp:Transcript_5710/g.8691  ORF Transcript_5710/g.8691 Transcript_5710/m.8691 type:complete len:202 (+) Transcript_5710:1597-2202(+)